MALYFCRLGGCQSRFVLGPLLVESKAHVNLYHFRTKVSSGNELLTRVLLGVASGCLCFGPKRLSSGDKE